MNAFKTLLAGAALAVTATAGNAAVFYADEVIVEDPGTCTGSVTACNLNDRNNTDNAKGPTDGLFYSLGLGGSAVFGFAQDVFPGGTISAFEITFNRNSDHDEAAEVYTLDSAFNVVQSLGTVLNSPNGVGSVYASMAFSYIRLVDVTETFFAGMSSSYDGYDVDSISVAPIPLPAAGTLLLAGLGGFAALRRRKTAA
jgi:hypothetical protein